MGRTSRSRRAICVASSARAGRDDSGLVRVDDSLDAVAEVELLEDAGDMGFCGRLGHDESLADFGVGAAAGEELEDLALSRSELTERDRLGSRWLRLATDEL